MARWYKDRRIVIGTVVLLAIMLGLICETVHLATRRATYPREFSEFVTAGAEEFGIPEAVIYATIKTESDFDANAVSPAGAQGLMQLMPATYRWISDDMLGERLDDSMISDPATNIRYGSYMLSWLYGIYGDWDNVFAAYNAGVGNVNAWLKDPRYSFAGHLTDIPFDETRNYVRRQQKNVKAYKKLYY